MQIRNTDTEYRCAPKIQMQMQKCRCRVQNGPQVYWPSSQYGSGTKYGGHRIRIVNRTDCTWCQVPLDALHLGLRNRRRGGFHHRRLRRERARLTLILTGLAVSRRYLTSGRKKTKIPHFGKEEDEDTCPYLLSKSWLALTMAGASECFLLPLGWPRM